MWQPPYIVGPRSHLVKEGHADRASFSEVHKPCVRPLCVHAEIATDKGLQPTDPYIASASQSKVGDHYTLMDIIDYINGPHFVISELLYVVHIPDDLCDQGREFTVGDPHRRPDAGVHRGRD